MIYPRNYCDWIGRVVSIHAQTHTNTHICVQRLFSSDAKCASETFKCRYCKVFASSIVHSTITAETYWTRPHRFVSPSTHRGKREENILCVACQRLQWKWWNSKRKNINCVFVGSSFLFANATHHPRMLLIVSWKIQFFADFAIHRHSIRWTSHTFDFALFAPICWLYRRSPDKI